MVGRRLGDMEPYDDRAVLELPGGRSVLVWVEVEPEASPPGWSGELRVLGEGGEPVPVGPAVLVLGEDNSRWPCVVVRAYSTHGLETRHAAEVKGPT